MKKTLDEQIEEETKLLEEEVVPVEEPEEEVEELTEPEVKPEVKDPSNDTIARMAWELREEKRQRAALEKQIEESSKPKVETPKAPDPEEDPLAYLQWELSETKRKANELSDWKDAQEKTSQQQQFVEAQRTGFKVAESQFAPTVPDYQEACDHMLGEMARSVKLLNPHANPAQVNSFVESQLLSWAEQAAQMGQQPAKALYDMSKSHFGFVKKPEEEKPVKPDLATIAKNQRKSGNGFSGQSTKRTKTMKDLESMSVADMDRMDPGELEDLMSA